MKIAIITAVFGGIDVKRHFCDQSIPEGSDYQRFFFNEENSPIPLPNLPPRLQAKYFKTQSHRIPMLQGYDIHIWIDGNIEVINKRFVSALIYPLYRDEYPKICIQKHHERSTILEEIKFILESMDNPYLRTRYGKQPLVQEYDYYTRHSMPPSAPLYSCNVFARKVGNVTNALFDEWWRLCVEWSWFDQSAFSYLTWADKHVVRTVDMGGVTTSPYYTLHSHTQWNQ